MIRPIVCAALLLAALPLAALARTANHAGDWNGAEINWRDARSGIYEASKTRRPVLMVFHATWCSFCKRFRKVFKDPAVVAASRDFVKAADGAGGWEGQVWDREIEVPVTTLDA
ncbi:MAG: thioredoxin family protein, partial [Hyphomicrobium sp.]|nr:thioredoxin family protein [Hyphomicrobium sp.]